MDVRLIWLKVRCQIYCAFRSRTASPSFPCIKTLYIWLFTVQVRCRAEQSIMQTICNNAFWSMVIPACVVAIVYIVHIMFITQIWISILVINTACSEWAMRFSTHAHKLCGLNCAVCGMQWEPLLTGNMLCWLST